MQSTWYSTATSQSYRLRAIWCIHNIHFWIETRYYDDVWVAKAQLTVHWSTSLSAPPRIHWPTVAGLWNFNYRASKGIKLSWTEHPILLWRNTWNSVMLNWSLLPIYRNQIMKYFTCQCTSYWRSRAQRRMCVLCLAHLLNPHPESLLMILYWLGLLYSYSSLGDVLLRFRHHQYKLTTDVSKMYRAIKLTPKWSILSSFCLEKESHRTSDGL